MYIYFVESSDPCKTNITVIESITSNVEDETKCVFIDLTTCPAPSKPLALPYYGLFCGQL